MLTVHVMWLMAILTMVTVSSLVMFILAADRLVHSSPMNEMPEHLLWARLFTRFAVACLSSFAAWQVTSLENITGWWALHQNGARLLFVFGLLGVVLALFCRFWRKIQWELGRAERRRQEEREQIRKDAQASMMAQYERPLGTINDLQAQVASLREDLRAVTGGQTRESDSVPAGGDIERPSAS